MGKAILVVFPSDIDMDEDDVAAEARVISGVVARLGADVSVIGWPPEQVEIAALLDPT